jgi:hypothetical protein
MSPSRANSFAALLAVLIACGCQASSSIPGRSGADATLGTQGASLSPAAKLSVTPKTMTLKTDRNGQAFLMPNNHFYTETDNCAGIATAKYFAYGHWQITPGETDATCAITFKDTVTKATAVMKVVNQG